jgi:peptide/nickel transport system substrate-binding protein
MADAFPPSLSTGQISRRWFLRMTGVTACLGIVAACAPAAPTSPTATPAAGSGQVAKPTVTAAAAATTAPAAPPKPAAEAAPDKSAAAGQVQRGGVIQIGLGGNLEGLEPHHNVSVISLFPVSPVYNGLLRLDAETSSKVVGDLAEKWTVSADGKEYLFTLKGADIKWHDGKPFSIDDVIFSLKKMGTPVQGKVVTMAAPFLNVASYEPVDARTLRLVLKQPSADFIWELSQDYAKILPKHVAEAEGGDMNKKAVGTGPFKLQDYRPGSSVALVKNPDYAVEPGRPYLDGIKFTIIPDRASLLAALAAGRIDTHGRAGPEQLESREVDQLLAQNPNLQKLQMFDLSGLHFFMNTRKPPFNDPRVRKAAFLALDRQLAIDVVASKGGALPGFFPPPWGLAQDELAQIPGFRQPKDQDLAESRRLLKDAGYANGLPFTLLTRVQPTIKEPAEFIGQQLSQVGFQPTLKPVEDAQFWPSGEKGDFDGMVFAPSSNLPIGDYARVIAPKGRLNYMGLDDDQKNNDLWQKQMSENDPDKRKAILKDIERYWYNELFGTAPLVWRVPFLVAGSRVKAMAVPAMSRGGMLFDTVWLT